MDQVEHDKATPDWFAAWTKTAADFWVSAAKTWTAGISDASQQLSEKFSGKPGGDLLQVISKTMQTAYSAMGSPEMLELAFKAANALPGAEVRILRTTLSGYNQVYQTWLKKSGKFGEAATAFSFEGLQADTFKGWAEFYEQEIKPFLNVPPVGLNRFYQQRASTAIDKYNQFQLAVAEFFHVLGLPVERSIKVMHDIMEEQAREGKLSANFKDYYNIWIKTLEGHYMSLYKSPEYIRVLSCTLNALDEYKGAESQVLMDFFQFLPIPTNRDMDALYRDHYEMEKKLAALTKKVQAMESLAGREVPYEPV